MHSMIPIQKDLKIQGGTNIEILIFTDIPYLEIFKDTNHTKHMLVSSGNPTLDDWLYNLQQLAFAVPGTEY